jgi:hypothetical protein
MATAQKRTFVNLFADDTELMKTFGSLPGAAPRPAPMRQVVESGHRAGGEGHVRSIMFCCPASRSRPAPAGRPATGRGRPS